MSAALYSTCLIWTGRNGIAKLRGLSLPLLVAPAPDGIAVAHIEYMPEVAVHRVCEVYGPWRDLEMHEILAVDRWLVRLFDEAKG